MQVNAKMPESMVDREQIGQKARIEVDAFPGEAFSGEVVEIAPLPDPTSFLKSNVKVYTTRVRIARNSPGLRPGMSARVEILLTQRDSALMVPVQSVLQLEGKDRVAVKKADGAFEWRDVTVGEANESEFEVEQGIKLGEQVVLAPMNLLSEEDASESDACAVWLGQKGHGGGSHKVTSHTPAYPCDQAEDRESQPGRPHQAESCEPDRARSDPEESRIYRRPPFHSK